jgi:ribulose kinase
MSSEVSVAMQACGWDDVFWQEIGLGDLVESGYATIGRSVAFPGHPLGTGLTRLAAQELGLVEGIPVGTSLIDAHAGGVGVLESYPREQGASVAFAMYSNYIHYKFTAICFVLKSSAA